MSSITPATKRKFNGYDDSAQEPSKMQKNENLIQYFPKDMLLEIVNNCTGKEIKNLRLVDKLFNKICDYANHWKILHDKERGLKGLASRKYDLKNDMSPLDSYFFNLRKEAYHTVVAQKICGMMDLAETRDKAIKGREDEAKLQEIIEYRKILF